MMILFYLFLLLQSIYASGMDQAKDSGIMSGLAANEASKGAFASENASSFANLNKWGISPNPHYQQTSDPKQLEEQASHKFRTDKTANLIQKSHQTREMVQVDLDHLEVDANGLLKNMGDANLTSEEGYEIKTCRTPGESYNRVCKRQRIIKLKITPEKREKQTYCPGHAKKERRGMSFHYSHWTEYCGGCDTKVVITQYKKVEVLREEWVGCEAEDKNHEEGLCELIDERPGPHNETRIIQGESVCRDYWETTRIYKCGVKVSTQ